MTVIRLASPGEVNRDRGAADALGLVLIAPVVLGLAVLVVALGRGVDSRAQVQSAAESAAQAAALERSPAAAIRSAESVADAMLTDPDSCADPSVSVDTSRFRAGGVVAVTIGCTTSTRAVEVVGGGARAVTVTAHATIDAFRATAGQP